MTMTDAPARKKHVDNRDPSVIRIATPDEMEDVLALCREVHADNNFMFSFSETKSRAVLERALTKQRAMVPCIGPKGAIEAAGFVSFEQFGWSEDWYLSEWFNFVRPAFRKSQHAKELLVWEKNAADQTGLYLFIGVVSDKRLSAKLRLYRRVFGAGLEPHIGRALKELDLDVDNFLRSCGCVGGYFVYKPPVLYHDRVAPDGPSH